MITKMLSVKKIYDVMFFYFSGSHLSSNPINEHDYKLLARRIKLAIDKPEGIIGHLLVEINLINSAIKGLEKTLHEEYDKKSDLVKRLQTICPHLEYISGQMYYDDEYGSTHDGNQYRKCVTCFLEEEVTPQYRHSDTAKQYKIIIGGTCLKSNKCKKGDRL